MFLGANVVFLFLWHRKRMSQVVWKGAIKLNYWFVACIVVTFARKDNSLRINRLVGLLENWVTR